MNLVDFGLSQSSSSSRLERGLPMSQDYDFRDDPRLAGMGLSEQRTLYPDEMPKAGETRYLILHTDEPNVFPEWENRPDGFWGDGRGLPEMDETPRFRLDALKKEITQPDVWRWRNVYLITKRMVDLITEFDTQAIDARPAEFLFSDGLPPDEPYFLADFVQKLEAVDLLRSVANYSTTDISTVPLYGHSWPTALKPNIPEAVHVCRDATGIDWGGGKADIFFSRAIVMEMVKRQFRRMSFWDPAIGSGQYQGDIILINTMA